MTQFYCIRHGQTDWNKAGLMQGDAAIFRAVYKDFIGEVISPKNVSFYLFQKNKGNWEAKQLTE